MKSKHLTFLFSGCLFFLSEATFAQHNHMEMPVKKDSVKHEMHDHGSMNGHDMKSMSKPDSMVGMKMHMSHAFSLSLPMNRNGSGTGWQPDATPMYAYMKHGSKWNYMLHGSLYLRYTRQNLNHVTYKGFGEKVSLPNYVMGMAQRQVGKNGLLTIRSMISLDRIFDGGAGYPLLFQSGETWKGNALVDRQHPHDLVSELAVGYTQRINRKMDVTLYAGYPGEPALGPTAFMHRMSAFNNPDAALGHHWQDATHITFGVLTAGFRYGKFKVEASTFTGREPNENRFNFDKPRFDSYSYRLLFNPSANWAFQASHGYIKSPEANHPEENINRTTASVQHSMVFNNKNRWISSSLVYGLNDSGTEHRENSVLAESNVQLNKWSVYGRYEWVQKSQEEFDIVPADKMFNHIYPVSVFTLGLNRQILSFSNTLLQAGIQTSVYIIDKDLQSFYGKNPVSGQIYLRLTPVLMRM
jgi:hypothetical protein